ncbi:MAG TPA: SRPBCC family protein [Candidatus Saccharimonadales bacterium]|nr:SRPBCC family protein [Candidatus Saccharimonadales bacterium]
MLEIKSPQNPIAEFAGNSHANGHRNRWQSTGSTVGSIVAGSMLAVYGVTRKSAGGVGLAAAGGVLAIRGILRAATPNAIHVERSFTINRPVSEVYDYFRNFENLPKFMLHLREVRVTGDKTSRWVAEAPLGFELEWDAEIVDEAQNRHLAWQSLPGTLIPNRGSVAFRPASEYHGGTEITVVLEYMPPAGRGGALFARVFGREPGMQIREDLRRLKQLLEAGEIPTTDGQPHGRRTAFARMVEAVNHQPKRRSETDHADRAHPWAEVG